MLPLILIGAGVVTTIAGALRAKRESTLSPAPSGAGTITSTALRRTAQWAPLVDRLRGDIPAWLVLGHILAESSGDPNRDAPVLTGQTLPERGLMQMHPGTSQDLGLDHSRMYDPTYNIAAGIRMYQTYAKSLQARASFASWDDLWRTAYFAFGVGPGRAYPYVQGKRGVTWYGVSNAIQACCNAGKCNSFVCGRIKANETVWQAGHQIEAQARALV